MPSIFLLESISSNSFLGVPFNSSILTQDPISDQYLSLPLQKTWEIIIIQLFKFVFFSFSVATTATATTTRRGKVHSYTLPEFSLWKFDIKEQLRRVKLYKILAQSQNINRNESPKHRSSCEIFLSLSVISFVFSLE